MPVPDIRREEECGVLGAGTATRSCANKPAEKVTYLDPRQRSQILLPLPPGSLFLAQKRDKQSRGLFPSRKLSSDSLARVRTEH